MLRVNRSITLAVLSLVLCLLASSCTGESASQSLSPFSAIVVSEWELYQSYYNPVSTDSPILIAHNLSELFLRTVADQYSHAGSSQDFDFTLFFDEASPNYDDMLRIQDEILAQKERYEKDALWSNACCEYREVSVENDTVYAQVYLAYDYIRADTPDMVSGNGTLYYFWFQPRDGVWYITNIVCPWRG